jgi:hypothetical protein
MRRPNALSLSDDTGERWYHGTADRKFSAFNPNHPESAPRGGGSRIGVFFTNSREQGDNFRRLALKYSSGSPDKNDGRVIEATIRGKFKSVDVMALEREAAKAKRAHVRDAKPSMLGRQREWMVREAQTAKREGYDGVDFINIMDDPLSYRNRATHRVVFPHRASDTIEITDNHVLPESGVVETTIAAARAAREARTATAKPPARSTRTSKPLKSWRF